MSVESSQAFLRVAYDSPEIARELRAVTGVREIVRLGTRHGYTFTVPELMEASSSGARPGAPTAPGGSTQDGPAGAAPDGPIVTTPDGPAGAAPDGPVVTTPDGPAGATPDGLARTRPDDTASGTRAGSRARDTPAGLLHHEYRLTDLPGFEDVIEQLPHLKVRPQSVDIGWFQRTFREEDLRSTDRSPADPEYRAWHDALARTGWRDPATGPDGPRRDFHLVNLDEHVDHPGYEAYFAAKRRTIDALEAVFDTEVRFSGSLWYPPSSYRLWHTNETQPGWRMYIVDLDGPFTDPSRTSFFRYMNPRTEEIVTLRERPGMVRFFKAEQDPARLFWHCIVNPTARHRWSFGFVVPDDWPARLARWV
ncbi:Nif11-like leader peptide family natural product precursor [Actinoallomurus purpureus]|uniref:Nif11-like leader peptide family natural product precursor n=1 Tax=Actinoallomurus purpureus TaxID=478114 RepID=UPI0025AF4D26|nr:Nif11 family protein [Actinoallomurus purpureus]